MQFLPPPYTPTLLAIGKDICFKVRELIKSKFFSDTIRDFITTHEIQTNKMCMDVEAVVIVLTLFI